MDWYLIGGSKAVIAVAPPHVFVVTQEMKQLVSENFKAIKEFKEHFLALQEQDIDRSSAKNVLIHHFKEIIDKVFNILTQLSVEPCDLNETEDLKHFLFRQNLSRKSLPLKLREIVVP